jgi:hypothetical protein
MSPFKSFFFRWVQPQAFLALLLLAGVPMPMDAANPEGPGAPIGRLLSSEAVSIEGRTAYSTSMEDFGEPSPLVFSGNKITMQKGIALLEFQDARGVVGFCGKTTVSILRSKSALLYALQSGTVSFDVTSAASNRVLSPEFVVEWKNEPGSGKNVGVVSLDPSGTLCVQSLEGRLKISDQLNGQHMELGTGLSVKLRSGAMDMAQLSKTLDCGCSGNLLPAPMTQGPDLPVFGGTALSEESVMAPGVPEMVPKKADSAEVQPVASASPVVPEAPSSPPSQPDTKAAKKRTLSIPSLKAKAAPPAGEHTAAIATMSVSAENLPPRPTKKQSLGTKVKNFFHRIFSRKSVEPPTEEPRQ